MQGEGERRGAKTQTDSMKSINVRVSTAKHRKHLGGAVIDATMKQLCEGVLLLAVIGKRHPNGDAHLQKLTLLTGAVDIE